jgi:glycerol-3-phosphate acyltransferase PlsY
MGRRAAAVVLLGDVGKGVVAAAAGWAAGGRTVGAACGLAAVLGHVAPATRRFRGGKGVATLVGAAVVLLPLPMLGLAAVWGLVAKLTGTASLGSLVVAGGLPLCAAVTGRPMGEVVAFAAAGLLVVARHRGNIDRLRRGEERSLSE